MRLLVSLIGLGIRVGGFPIRLLGNAAGGIRRRLSWLRPVGQVGLRFLVAVSSNRIASTAIMLSVINFALLMWQIWPEHTGQTTADLSQPARTSQILQLDDTPGRITELENQIRDLSRDQRFQFDRIIDCINYPSPFGCPRYTP